MPGKTPSHRLTEMCAQSQPGVTSAPVPSSGHSSPYLTHVTTHVALAGAPMLAGLGQAGVQLLLTVAACAALWAHAIVGAVLVHTLPASLTQPLWPHPCRGELHQTHITPSLPASDTHHPTSLLALVARVSPSIGLSHMPPNWQGLSHQYIRTASRTSFQQLHGERRIHHPDLHGCHLTTHPHTLSHTHPQPTPTSRKDVPTHPPEPHTLGHHAPPHQYGLQPPCRAGSGCHRGGRSTRGGKGSRRRPQYGHSDLHSDRVPGCTSLPASGGEAHGISARRPPRTAP